MPSEKILPAKAACRDLVDELVSTDESLLSLPTRVHVAECLRCQAELASYRRLRRDDAHAGERSDRSRPHPGTRDL